MWEKRFTWFIVDNEGQLTRPWRDNKWVTLDDTFSTPEEAVERLELFYANSDLFTSTEEEHHILEKVYVKDW